jgi:uncharacterized protein
MPLIDEEETSPQSEVHSRQARMAELGKLGGPAKLARYGVEAFRDMGKRGGARGGRTLLAERGTSYFRELGHRGGAAMRESGKLSAVGKVAGETTLARHGAEHFQRMAEMAAIRKRAAVARRNDAICYLLERGFSIPRVIGLTLGDLPRLAMERLLEGPVTTYLGERPASDDSHIFLSGSGRRLLPANMYRSLRDQRAMAPVRRDAVVPLLDTR